MTGTLGAAYRTPVIPQSDPTASVYAIHPAATYDGGTKSTTYLFVVSSDVVGDTIIHPCDRDGDVLALELLGCVTICNHRAALRSAGYELEVVRVRA